MAYRIKMHLCHAEECITSVCFAALLLILSLFLVQYLSHNLGHTPPFCSGWGLWTRESMCPWAVGCCLPPKSYRVWTRAQPRLFLSHALAPAWPRTPPCPPRDDLCHGCHWGWLWNQEHNRNQELPNASIWSQMVSGKGALPTAPRCAVGCAAGYRRAATHRRPLVHAPQVRAVAVEQARGVGSAARSFFANSFATKAVYTKSAWYTPATVIIVARPMPVMTGGTVHMDTTGGAAGPGPCMRHPPAPPPPPGFER